MWGGWLLLTAFLQCFIGRFERVDLGFKGVNFSLRAPKLFAEAVVFSVEGSIFVFELESALFSSLCLAFFELRFLCFDFFFESRELFLFGGELGDESFVLSFLFFEGTELLL